MATPTWRNISTGGDGGAGAILAGATRTFDQAFGNLNNVLNSGAELSQQNFQNQQALQQRALENQRADAQLVLAQNRDNRAERQLEDSLLTNRNNRQLANAQENRAISRFNREQVLAGRADENLAQQQSADAAVQGIVEAADNEQDLVFRVRDYAQKNKLDALEENRLLQIAQQRDQALFGTTPAQQQVLQEQDANDQLQLQIFDRESGNRSQEVAVQLGVNPDLLRLGQGDNNTNALRNDINRRAGDGVAEDIISYFTEEIGRIPTVDELTWVVAQASEQNFTPFSDSEIDLDSRRLIGTGYKGYIDQYKDAIGVGNSAQRKRVNQYQDYLSKEAELRNILVADQNTRRAAVTSAQRNNNKAKFGGLTTNPVFAQTGNTQSVERGLARLEELRNTLSGRQ